jgi:peroxin-5
MADCGAAGTTLDRAARAVLGPDQSASKHLGNLFHAGMATQGPQTGMPMAAPDHLVMPNHNHNHTGPRIMANNSAPMMSAAQAQAASMHHPSMGAIWNAPQQQQQQPHAAGPMMMSHHPAMQQQQQQPHYMQQQMFQQQQQQHQMMMMQQQQQQQQQQHQMMMMQQQQQQQAMQQAEHAAMATKSAAAKSVAEKAQQHQQENNIENWHDGLEDHIADELKRSIDDDAATLGHEGIVNGASIEELASAWAQAEAEYDEHADDQEDFSNLWQGEMPQVTLQPYEFIHKQEQQSPPEMLDWMSKGLQQFQEGNLKQAIYSFEMELQHKNPDNAAAWRMLGRCHAENDQDPEAIKCLEAAVDRDPYSPESLLALGVSYVNELNHEKALENLKGWFTHNPKYAGMDLPDDIYGAVAANTAAGTSESAFEEVKRLLLSALDFDSTDAGEVYEALGVIYNVNKDYDAAAGSFRKALENRPDDYQLWNKLGATLANGSRSEEALPAYHKALQIKPKYARAWLNMAISHSNLQDHSEAARCYLQTLSLNPAAAHCWTYLRMALSSSEQWDLLPLVFSQDLSAFREHYDFVMHDS